MPSKDTIIFHLPKRSYDEIMRVKQVLEKETGLTLTKKQAEIFNREKAKRIKLTLKESHQLINDIFLGRIKW